MELLDQRPVGLGILPPGTVEIRVFLPTYRELERCYMISFDLACYFTIAGSEPLVRFCTVKTDPSLKRFTHRFFTLLASFPHMKTLPM